MNGTHLKNKKCLDSALQNHFLSGRTALGLMMWHRINCPHTGKKKNLNRDNIVKSPLCRPALSLFFLFILCCVKCISFRAENIFIWWQPHLEYIQARQGRLFILYHVRVTAGLSGHLPAEVHHSADTGHKLRAHAWQESLRSAHKRVYRWKYLICCFCCHASIYRL